MAPPPITRRSPRRERGALDQTGAHSETDGFPVPTADEEQASFILHQRCFDNRMPFCSMAANGPRPEPIDPGKRSPGVRLGTET